MCHMNIYKRFLQVQITHFYVLFYSVFTVHLICVLSGETKIYFLYISTI